MMAGILDTFKKILSMETMTDEPERLDPAYEFIFSRQLNEIDELRCYLDEAISILKGNLDMKTVGKTEHPFSDVHNAPIFKTRIESSLLLIESAQNNALMMLDEIEKQLGRHHGLVGPV